jgi:glucokinase
MKRFAVGVDLGGTNLRVAALDEQGNQIEQIRIATLRKRGRDDVIDRLCKGILELAERWKSSYELAGIGVGIPGIINMKEGILVFSPNFPGWENYRIQAQIMRKINSPIFLENDANAAALGEKWMGSGKDVDNLCFLTLGTGVGGGLILNGKIWHGKIGMAAELGHTTVYADGRSCNCGNHGCLESYASATGVVRSAQELLDSGQASPGLKEAAAKKGELTSAIIYRLAAQGDPSSRKIYEGVGIALGIAIGNFINTLDIDTFVLGGGVVDAWNAFAPSLFEEVKKRSYIYARDPRRILKSSLGDQAGIFGAACLAF